MPFHQPIPRIHVDFLDSSPHNLSSSNTLDIRDILDQVKLLPTLFTEHVVFDDADDALYWEHDHSHEVPPFPTGHQPPLFILNSHRVRLPFPIRSEAFELGDFCWDEEDAYPLLTSPTIPRMKLMIKEQLYVQKWVDTLTPECPPKHIPWTCESPAAERKWIAEGTIFPAAVVKSPLERRRVIKECSHVTDTNRSLVLTDQVSYAGQRCTFSATFGPTDESIESNTSTSHILAKSTDVNPGILRGELKTLQTPSHHTVRTSQGPSPPALLPSDPPIRTTSATPSAFLATRRGKSLSHLKLKGSVIEQLEYPDIPTAFRGSPGVWSSRSDAFPILSFTDHQSMLLDLKSRCVALGSGSLTYTQEPPHPRTETVCSSLSVGEWTFMQGLATFDNHLLGLIDSQVSRENLADTGTFLPDDCSTPAKGPGSTACLGSAPRLHPMSTLLSFANCSGDAPEDPLPLRPALISPSTPLYVRGILKKAKSVRFEDTIPTESEDSILPSISSPQTPVEGSSPPVSAVSFERPCTPMPNVFKPSSGAAKVKEIPGLSGNVQKKMPAPRSRLPLQRTRDGNHEPTHLNIGKAPESSKASSTATSIKRPCRAAHVEKNTSAVAIHTRAKQKGWSSAETDVRRGIEGTTKNRLSAPLRNIFRFK